VKMPHFIFQEKINHQIHTTKLFHVCIS
jgi:hypothetical protein